MKTTRRQFLKSLLATAATAAIAPQVLVEMVHGASELTAQERDIAADVMGLRQLQWPGAELWHPKTMRRTTWPDGARMTDKIDDWDIEHGNLIMFPEAKTELFIEGVGWQEIEVPDLYKAIGAPSEINFPVEPEHDRRGGYLIPEQFREQLLKAIIDGSPLVGKAITMPMRGMSPVERFVRASWTELNLYDSESRIV